MATRIYYVVQSVPKDVPEDRRKWGDVQFTESKIIGYGEVNKMVQNGDPKYLWRLVKRTITEEIEYQGWDE